ncbi:MAG: RNA polymerase sigma factor [Patescibacteria group bacterium]
MGEATIELKVLSVDLFEMPERYLQDLSSDTTGNLGAVGLSTEISEYNDGTEVLPAATITEETPVLPHQAILSEIVDAAPEASVATHGIVRALYGKMDRSTLVEHAMRGDKGAFGTLAEQTYKDMLTLAYRLTGSYEDAQDVVQEAYVKALKYIAGFRGNADFKTWMYRVTANCANTHTGKAKKDRHEDVEDVRWVSALEDQDEFIDPAKRAAYIESKGEYERAVWALPTNQRVVLVLRDIYDLSNREIAIELGISDSAVKVRLHRARRNLIETTYEGGTQNKSFRETPSPGAAKEPEVVDELGKTREEVQAVISRYPNWANLSRSEKKVIILREARGWTHTKIADVMKMKNARRSMRVFLKAKRKLLDDEYTPNTQFIPRTSPDEETGTVEEAS